MNDHFFQQLPFSLIMVENAAVSSFNKSGKKLFPQLTLGEDGTWLGELLSSSQGKVQLGGKHYRYSVHKEGEEIMYTLDLVEEPGGLNQSQLNHLSYHVREDLSRISASVEGMSEKETPRHSAVNRALSKLQRLFANVEMVTTEDPQANLTSVDLSALLHNLCGKLEEKIPQVQFRFVDTAENTMVQANKEYLYRVILGLVGNSMVDGTQIQLKLTKIPTHAILEVTDDKKLQADANIIDLLRGVTTRIDPKKGAGFGLPAIQKHLKAMNCDLWAEEGATGGLVLRISIPLSRKNETMVQSSIQDRMDGHFSWEEIRIELSTVLGNEYFYTLSDSEENDYL